MVKHHGGKVRDRSCVLVRRSFGIINGFVVAIGVNIDDVRAEMIRCGVDGEELTKRELQARVRRCRNKMDEVNMVWDERLIQKGFFRGSYQR